MADSLRFGQDFWEAIDQLVVTRKIVIDRPKGSRHPQWNDLVYPLDHGYLEGTGAVDGGSVDVFIGSLPARNMDALILTCDLGKNDVEVKLLLGCTEEENEIALRLTNQSSIHGIKIQRNINTTDFILKRRSVRHFQDRDIPRGVIDRVLGAAACAPSAHHLQPWRFAVISSPKARYEVAGVMATAYEQDLITADVSQEEAHARAENSIQRIHQAPVAIMLCLDEKSMREYPDSQQRDFEYIMAVQGVAMAGENLLLAAQAEGLGAVWLCAPLFAGDAARRVLNLPREWIPQGMILLGYQAKDPLPRIRRKVSELVRYYD